MIICRILELQHPGSLSELFSQLPLAFQPLSACFSHLLLFAGKPHTVLPLAEQGLGSMRQPGWEELRGGCPSLLGVVKLCLKPAFGIQCWALPHLCPFRNGYTPQNPRSHCYFTPCEGPATGSDHFHKALFPSMCLNSSFPSHLWSRKWRQSRQSHLLLGNSPNTAVPGQCSIMVTLQRKYFFKITIFCFFFGRWDPPSLNTVDVLY